LKSWESFYTRRLYHRIQDCWNRPICSSPGAYIEVMERASNDDNATLHLTGNTIRALNMGSYNYLGFAENWRETCGDEVLKSLSEWPVAMCASRSELGNYSIIAELEEFLAKFLGKEAVFVHSMGFGTNSTTLPAIIGPECLLISDSLNHTSLVSGSRASTASIRVFKHNNVAHLESVLRESIIRGQPKFGRAWKKIIVVVEGIYSMEGEICNLGEIVEICKKYKAYLYVDEAHSIGALGSTGRGVTEHCKVNPADVDILMGTFSKSFGGMGGYVAGTAEVIDRVRTYSHGALNHVSLSPIVAAQVLTALRIIANPDPNGLGQTKIRQLHDNSNFFRREMEKMGVHSYGDDNSPIIPVLIYCPSKIVAFSRECLKRGVAVVVVGFPATSVVLSRARFCISAAHTREDLEKAVKVIDEVTELLCMKYNKSITGATTW
jgi:serine palmitoyltransferase